MGGSTPLLPDPGDSAADSLTLRREKRNWWCDQKWGQCPVSLQSLLSSVLPHHVLKEPCHREKTTHATLLLYSSTGKIHSHGLQDIRETAVFECGLLTCSSWSVGAGMEGSRIYLLGCERTQWGSSGLSGEAAECVQARVRNPKDLVHPRGRLRGKDPSVALAVGIPALRVWDSFSPPPVDSSV